MSPRKLAEARAARDTARANFDAQLAQLRGEPATHSIGGRIADRLSDDARAGLDHVLDVASENKGVIGATIAALALWFLRHPIIAWVERQLGEKAEATEEAECND